MDPGLALVAVLLMLVVAVAASAALVIALVRSGEVRALRGRVERLERELGRRGPVSAPSAAPSAARAEPTPAPQPAHASVAPPASVALPARAPEPARATVAPAAHAPAPTPRAPTPARKPIQWERWFGVQGAAVLGGVFLALGGLLFVQYSIERGWLSPAVRCVLGAVCGLGALIGSTPLLRRDYRITSHALVGAGVTLIFAATWAAYALYELIPFALALPALIATTVCCGMLATRRKARTIAWFGLAGGFATPLLLSFDPSRPLGLFLYLLGLDAAVLSLSARRGWTGFASAAALAVHLLFAVWVARAFDPDEAAPALVFCGALAALFAALGPRAGRPRAEVWLGVALPFAFATYFARAAHLPEHVAPMAALLALLGACAGWVAARQREPRLLLVAGLGSAAAMAMWISATAFDAALAWECAASLAVLAAVPHGAAELMRRGEHGAECARRAADSAGPLALCVLFAAARSDAPVLAPWLVAAVTMAALQLRSATLGDAPALRMAAAVGPALAFALWRVIGAGAELDWPAGWLGGAVSVALVGAAFAAGSAPSAEVHRRWGRNACVAAAVVLLLVRPHVDEVGGAGACGETLLVVVVGLLAARGGAIVTGFVALAAAALWSIVTTASTHSAATGGAALALAFGTLVALTAAPLIDPSSLGARRPVRRVGAAAVVIWSFLLVELAHQWRDDIDNSVVFAVQAALAALACAVDWPRRDECGDSARRSAASVGFTSSGVAAALLAGIALALTFDRAEFPILLAVFTAGVAWLASVARSSPLRTTASIAGAATLLALAVRLGEFITAFEPPLRTGWPVWHWLGYDFGVPAALLLVAARLARRPANARGVLDSALSLSALLAVFLWLNVEVVNLCSSGERFAFELERMPTRDYALSAAWTVFAFALLVLGVRRASSALRWTSLAFFLATIGKVFLYDLGELRGLHRVASLVGLAIALLGVSLLYQRFVFRREAPE